MDEEIPLENNVILIDAFYSNNQLLKTQYFPEEQWYYFEWEHHRQPPAILNHQQLAPDRITRDRQDRLHESIARPVCAAIPYIEGWVDQEIEDIEGRPLV